jgi:hypothetical protein
LASTSAGVENSKAKAPADYRPLGSGQGVGAEEAPRNRSELSYAM